VNVPPRSSVDPLASVMAPRLFQLPEEFEDSEFETPSDSALSAPTEIVLEAERVVELDARVT